MYVFVKVPLTVTYQSIKNLSFNVSLQSNTVLHLDLVTGAVRRLLLSADGNQTSSRTSNWWNSKEQQVRGVFCLHRRNVKRLLALKLSGHLHCSSEAKTERHVLRVCVRVCTILSRPCLYLTQCDDVCCCREDIKCAVTLLTKTGFSSTRRMGKIFSPELVCTQHSL